MSAHDCKFNCGGTDCPAPIRVDPALEVLSDKVRSGEPIGFLEAIAVINYQEQLRAEREADRRKTLLGRLMLWITGKLNDQPQSIRGATRS